MMPNPPPDARQVLLGQLLRAVTLVLSVLILALASCTMHAQYRRAQAIEHGADPIAAACAFSFESGDACALAAARARP